MNRLRYFIRAKDLDGLRFRRQLKNYAIVRLSIIATPMVHSEDKAAFDSISLHRIIGQELMLEHVHPNLTGYAVMS